MKKIIFILPNKFEGNKHVMQTVRSMLGQSSNQKPETLVLFQAPFVPLAQKAAGLILENKSQVSLNSFEGDDDWEDRIKSACLEEDKKRDLLVIVFLEGFCFRTMSVVREAKNLPIDFLPLYEIDNTKYLGIDFEHTTHSGMPKVSTIEAPEIP